MGQMIGAGGMWNINVDIHSPMPRPKEKKKLPKSHNEGNSKEGK